MPNIFPHLLNQLKWIHFTWIILFLASPVIQAHDIGILKVKFSTLKPFTYQLSIEKAVGKTITSVPPDLPQHCTYQNTTETPLPNTWLFSCEVSIHNDAKLHFYWNVDALLIESKNTSDQHFAVRGDYGISIGLNELLIPSDTNVLNVFAHYFQLGFEHILEGWDHLLFILALMLLIKAPVTLFKAVLGFTLGHSVTLIASCFDMWTISRSAIEILIALSIAILAGEVITSKSQPTSWSTNSPIFVASVFGLLHGLGFSGALSDIGLQQQYFLVSLLAFNCGIEAGQLVFISIVTCMTFIFSWIVPYSGKLNRVKAYLPGVSAYGIGVVGMLWVIQRSTEIFSAI